MVGSPLVPSDVRLASLVVLLRIAPPFFFSPNTFTSYLDCSLSCPRPSYADAFCRARAHRQREAAVLLCVHEAWRARRTLRYVQR